MNLYKVIFAYHAPKGIGKGIKALVLAESDEKVYKWIASEPKIGQSTLFNSWKEIENYAWDEQNEAFIDEDGNECRWVDDDGNPENFKERMLRLKGEIDDDSVDFSNSYYGLELLGWQLLKENVTTNYSELMELGIVFCCLVNK